MHPNFDPAASEASSPPAAGRRGSFTGDLVNVLRGFCMGAADTVPGVSGGTVALVLGHYQRLLAAISHVDTKAFALTRAGRWSDLWKYSDLRFLIALILGIIIGAGSLATTMHWLLEYRMPQTFAVFFGLVVGSGWIVGKGIRHWSPAVFFALLAAAMFAFALAGLPVGQATTHRPYLFFSAAIAICAMILPGISGAFVLLVLGMYHPVIGMVKQFVHGDISMGLIADLAIFAAGCLIGLAAFSRLLQWLLRVHTHVTLAALVGLMIGSLRRIWPLQRVTQETAGLPFKEQQFTVVPPGDWNGSLLLLVLLAVFAALAVWVIERLATTASPHKPLHPS